MLTDRRMLYTPGATTGIVVRITSRRGDGTMSDEFTHAPGHRAEPVPPAPGRIVVPGGTGFIGSHLVPALTDAGHEVVVLSREQRADIPHARVAQWDPRAEGPWHEQLSGATAVINLCGASVGAGRWSEARKRQLIESRTVPSKALVAACNRLDDPPAALLQASGVNYYGTGEAERDEYAPPGNDFLARLAIDWEAPLDATPIRTVSMRFGAVLDAEDGALPQMLQPFRYFAGGALASGRQWLSWIHVRDLVSAIMFLLDSPLTDAVNVTAPNPVRNRDFARAAGRALNRPAWLRTPRFVLQGLLGEQATLVCDGVRAVPAKLEEAGFRFRFADIDSALDDLVG